MKTSVYFNGVIAADLTTPSLFSLSQEYLTRMASAPIDFRISFAILWFSGSLLMYFSQERPLCFCERFCSRSCVQANDRSVTKWYPRNSVLFNYLYEGSMPRRELKGTKGIPLSKPWALYFTCSSVRPNWLQILLPLAKLGFTLFPHRAKLFLLLLKRSGFHLA